MHDNIFSFFLRSSTTHENSIVVHVPNLFKMKQLLCDKRDNHMMENNML